jgi:archaellum biogenesis protein FlaJ (TadC family)
VTAAEPASGEPAGPRTPASAWVLDRALYALFGRHADGDRHGRDRHRYRGTAMALPFDLYLARVYGLSWVAFASVAVPAVVLVAALPSAAVDAATSAVESSAGVPLPALPRTAVAVGVGLPLGLAAKRATVRLGSTYLRWRATARRNGIERTLPGAAKYLHVLASGSDGHRAMLQRVADTDAYGETAVSFRRALNTAQLTGSIDEGLRRVARDTPSRSLLAPFLLKFREHANQGSDALANYLRMESRMLGHRQSRERDRAEGFLELLSEMFMVLLVLPSLLVIVITVMSVIAPELSAPVETPLGTTTPRGLIVYGSAVFVAGVGAGAAALVDGLKPPDQTISYRRPSGVLATLATATANPASAAVALAAPAVLVGAALWALGLHPVNVALLSYVAYAVPVGGVAVRRAHVDDAKDRELKDFVHAVSGHVSLGRPFPEAVERVAREVDLGPLDDDVASLAHNLRTTTRGGEGDPDVRTAALDRFVDRVGTPLAEQSVGLVTGALDGGSDAETIFDTLQTEIGRLYHEKRALRSSMVVYVAVGWTTALLVIGITIAVSVHVFDGFAQLSAVANVPEYVLDTQAIDLSRERFRVYVVTQATMLASGWFAGTASRGRYEALLHSGALVAVCYVVYAGVGLV